MNITGMNMSRKTGEAQREDRRRVVAANLLAGLTYREMAAALDISLGTVTNDVGIILGRWKREQVETADECAQIELRRLDRIVNAIWTDVQSGKLSSIDRMLKIMERRARLLGLDAKQELDVTSGGEPIRVVVGGIDLDNGV